MSPRPSERREGRINPVEALRHRGVLLRRGISLTTPYSVDVQNDRPFTVVGFPGSHETSSGQLRPTVLIYLPFPPRPFGSHPVRK